MFARECPPGARDHLRPSQGIAQAPPEEKTRIASYGRSSDANGAKWLPENWGGERIDEEAAWIRKASAPNAPGREVISNRNTV